VIDIESFVVGTISRGDVLRHLDSGGSQDDKLTKVSNKNYKFLREGFTNFEKINNLTGSECVVPIVNKEGHLVDCVLYPYSEILKFRKKKKISARVPLRVSFIGGGYDMPSLISQESYSVITSAINRFSYAILTPRDDEKIIIESEDLNMSESFTVQNIGTTLDGLGLVKAIILLMRPSRGFHLKTISDVMPFSGLGGSSAVAVAFIAVLADYMQVHLTEYDIAMLAFHAERTILRVSGGWQDQFATAMGGINRINFSSDDVEIKRFTLNDDVTYELQSCLSFYRLQDVLRSKDFKHPSIRSLMSAKELNELVSVFEKNTYDGNVAIMGKIVNEGWADKLERSPEAVPGQFLNAYANAMKIGAYGGKMLGAGGGGYALILAPIELRHRLNDEMAKHGFYRENIGLEPGGIKVWHKFQE
jgi:D-glycero-alpha-D-manno-heptose-7-phosphate kinase